MFRTQLFRRIVMVIVVAMATGGLAATSPDGTAQVVLFIGTLTLLGLVWWTLHPTIQAAQEMTSALHAWRQADGPIVRPPLASGDLEPLWDALERYRLLRLEQYLIEGQQQVSLQNDANLLRAVLATMVEGVMVIDSESRLLFSNAAAREQLNLNLREGSTPIVHEVLRSAPLQDLIRDVLADQQPRSVEIELLRSGRVALTTACTLPREGPAGLLVVMHDVTNLRRLERLRRDFVSNVSHELKTPLTSIQAFADTLLDGAIEDPGVREGFVVSILEQADRLHRLILDLIVLAQLESQQQPLELEALSVSRVIEDCVRRQQAIADSKHQILRFDPVDPALTVLADHEGVQTILDNLIRNALAYTPEQGEVTVRANRMGEWVVLEVEDNGIGIPADKLSRIFERFYRVDKARSREVGGTGLGLAIVKHMTQQHEGRVEVESTQGVGSRFRVLLRPPSE